MLTSHTGRAVASGPGYWRCHTWDEQSWDGWIRGCWKLGVMGDSLSCSPFRWAPRVAAALGRHIAHFGSGWMSTAGLQHPDLEQGEPNLRGDQRGSWDSLPSAAPRAAAGRSKQRLNKSNKPEAQESPANRKQDPSICNSGCDCEDCTSSHTSSSPH